MLELLKLKREISKPPIRRVIHRQLGKHSIHFSKPPIRRVIKTLMIRALRVISKPPIRRVIRVEQRNSYAMQDFQRERPKNPFLNLPSESLA